MEEMKHHSESSFSKLIIIANELRRASTVAYLPEPLQNLNVTQMHTILYIHDHQHEVVFQKDIESHLRIRRSSVSTVLNNLEKSGLIMRIPVPEDARLKKVLLTDKGNATFGVIEVFFDEIDKFMKNILSAEEQTVLLNVLEKIMRHMDSYVNEMLE